MGGSVASGGEQLRAAVLELPAEFREAVVLCGLEELSYEEAARLLDCPVGTIRIAAAPRAGAPAGEAGDAAGHTRRRGGREPVRDRQEKRQ